VILRLFPKMTLFSGRINMVGITFWVTSSAFFKILRLSFDKVLKVWEENKKESLNHWQKEYSLRQIVNRLLDGGDGNFRQAIIDFL
jgi:hypothetical protein